MTVTHYVDAQETGYDWSENWVRDFPIHRSCNNTQYNQISQGLLEAQEIAAHARDHTMRFGNESEFYRKYFGDETPSGEVVGWFSNVVDADKSQLLFRCDDPDDNCRLPGWAGHWRGENGSNENVICDLSYTSRRRLSQVCGLGYSVSTHRDNLFWATDLLHRIWHTDSLGQGVVGHYADTYDDCLELAQTNSSQAVRNSATLRLYALDVWAYDISIPGEGCTEPEDAQSTGTVTATPSTQTGSGSECHTHANGETHCV